MCLLQLLTCKDAINSDTKSEEKDLYLVSEVTRYNKIFEYDLQGTAISETFW